MAVTTIAAEMLAHNPYWADGGWWPIFPIFWLLFWGVLIFVLFRTRRSWFRRHPFQSGESVLAERYARGEISESEYRERLNVLKSTPS